MNFKDFSCFSKAGNWYKGNLHSHTTRSDGDATPEKVVSWYRRHGYDFLAITDHDTITDVSALPGGDMLLIPGVEFAYEPDEEPGFFLDMLGINLKTLPEFLDPEKKNHVTYDKKMSPQKLIDYINEAGGLPIMCHPYFMLNMTEPYLKYHSYLGLEAYNYVCEDMCGRGNHEIYWDALIHRGRKVYGFATDDSHAANFGHAWIEVKAQEKTLPAILQAIREGSFYATSGIRIFDVELTGRHVKITFDRPCDVVFVTRWGNMVRSFANTHELVDGQMRFSAEVDFGEHEKYLRIELRDANGNRAYTNPVFFE